MAELTGEAGLGVNLNVLGSNLGKKIHFAAQFEQLLEGLGSFHTAQQLKQALEEQLSNLAGMPLSVLVTVTPDDVQYALAMNEAFTSAATSYAIDVDLPDAALAFQTGAEVTVAGTAQLGLRFGLSLGGATPGAERFYLVTGPDSRASLTFDGVAPVNTDATLGLLSVTIAGGSLEVAGRTGGVFDPAKSAAVTVALVDPSATADGKITVAEIAADPARMALFVGGSTGDDKIQLADDLTVPAEIYGDAGDDQLRGGVRQRHRFYQRSVKASGGS